MERLGSKTLRASAALTSSLVASTGITLEARTDTAVCLCTYTRGTAGGAARLYLEGSLDGSTWHRLGLIDGASGAEGEPTSELARVPVYGAVYDLPAPPDDDPMRLALPPVDVRGFASLRVVAVEYGATGTPGTLAVVASEIAS